MNNTPRSRKNDLVVQEMDGEVLIYDLKIDKAFCLNETSMLVWQNCDGINSTAEISKILSKKLKTPANEDIVWLALDQLKKENLIANSEELEDNFAGMTRREVIKKVGLGTMVALPIVAGMAAPTSLQAQSACVGNQMTNCNTTTMMCCTGNTCMVVGGQGAANDICCVTGTTGNTLNGMQAGTDLDLGSQTFCNGTTTAYKNTQCQTSRSTFCCSGMAAWDGNACDGAGEIECNCIA